MKRVVCVLDGVIGEVFLSSVLQKYFSNNLYVIIVRDSAMIPEKVPSAFSFHQFDPTSEFHLSQTLQEYEDTELSDVFIIIDDPDQSRAVCEITRRICKDARIVTLAHKLHAKDNQTIQVKPPQASNSKPANNQPNIKNTNHKPHTSTSATHKDERTIAIDDASLVAGQFISRLPNVPIIPSGFGLGKGEIMEVGVPFGSVFAYRHIGSIQQKNYKIIGVYRNDELLLSTFSLIIQPQDVVLIAGDPQTLTNIYKQIKSDMGQFPSPFGRDIYVYVDMLAQDSNVIVRDVEQAIFLHNTIRSTRLVVVVLNPADFATLYRIKSLCQQDMSIILRCDYANAPFITRLEQDKTKRIGLIVVGAEIFSKRANRKALYNTATPVLKTATLPLQEARKSLVIVNEEMNGRENISSVIFDIALQMKLDIQVYDFDPDGAYQNAILKDYEALGRSFGKKVQITKTASKNPIFYLQEARDPILHFLPFERCITHTKALAPFSTKVEKLAPMLNIHPQIFIPIS